MPDRTRSSEDPCAWLVGAFTNRLYATALDPDESPEWRKVRERARTGKQEITDYFPSEFYGYYDLGRVVPELKTPPPLFLLGGGVPIVTEACAEVLRRFELGRTELRPVNLLRKNRKTPVLEGRYFGLFPGENRFALVPEATTLKLEQFGENPPLFQTYDAITDDAVALSSEALPAPDLWIERSLISRMIVSDRLGRALIEPGWKDVMQLIRCRIVGPDAGKTA